MKYWKAYALALGFVLLVAAAKTIPNQLWFQATGTGAALRKIAEKESDVVSVKDFGVKCDGTDDAALFANASAQAVLQGKSLLVDCKMTITTAAGTISAPLKFEGNGAIDYSAGGASVTLAGPILAPISKILYPGSGTLTMTGLADAVSPQWWGAIGDGVVDDTVALTAAIAAVGGSTSLVSLPCPGPYKATITGHVDGSPILCGYYGSQTLNDDTQNTKSEFAVHHNGAGGAQTYGVDIHNYPDSESSPTAGTGAHSALAIHQYSDRDQAVQIDQTRSAGVMILRLTHNEVLATGQHGTGPYIDFVGYTAGKPYPANSPVLMGRLEGGSPGTPLTFSSKESDTPWAFRSDTTAPSLKITQSNAGPALSVTSASSATNAVSITASTAAIGFNESCDSNTNGFFCMLVTGYSHGPKFTTTINSGPALTLTQPNSGGNQLFFLDNRGAGASIRLSTDGSNTVGSFTAAGEITTTSTKMKGTCTLNGASPAVCTATILSAATCIAVSQGTTAAAAVPLAVSVTTTTLTVTGANGLTNTVNYICLG